MSSDNEARQKLKAVTESAINTIEVRADAAEDLEFQFADIQRKFEEAAQLKDDGQRDLRMKVLKANFEELRRDSNKEEQDLAQAVFGLNAMLESMGEEYSELGTLSSNEKDLVTSAEKAVEQAKKDRMLAETKWFVKQSAMTDADQSIKDAEAKLEQTRVEARRLARSRLINANLDSSLQEFMVRVQRTVIESGEASMKGEILGASKAVREAILGEQEKGALKLAAPPSSLHTRSTHGQTGGAEKNEEEDPSALMNRYLKRDTDERQR